MAWPFAPQLLICVVQICLVQHLCHVGALCTQNWGSTCYLIQDNCWSLRCRVVLVDSSRRKLMSGGQYVGRDMVRYGKPRVCEKSLLLLASLFRNCVLKYKVLEMNLWCHKGHWFLSQVSDLGPPAWCWIHHLRSPCGRLVIVPFQTCVRKVKLSFCRL